MRTIVCIYCQLPFTAPAADCPHCGSAVDDAARPVQAANDNQALLDHSLTEEDLDEEFELIPVGHRWRAPSVVARATQRPARA